MGEKVTLGVLADLEYGHRSCKGVLVQLWCPHATRKDGRGHGKYTIRGNTTYVSKAKGGRMGRGGCCWPACLTCGALLVVRKAILPATAAAEAAEEKS